MVQETPMSKAIIMVDPAKTDTRLMMSSLYFQLDVKNSASGKKALQTPETLECQL